MLTQTSVNGMEVAVLQENKDMFTENQTPTPYVDVLKTI